eukprot:TRINITY_DN25762_c0_g1_i4.p1 TRINITY_DN25762_c0_g1~~TRINITY_DN25762_c0_g1_i4.p1  ORF type:complete len:378 (-),score=56.05 TRINITY_DN25762_c0_g1_i4:116-1249(-)
MLARCLQQCIKPSLPLTCMRSQPQGSRLCNTRHEHCGTSQCIDIEDLHTLCDTCPERDSLRSGGGFITPPRRSKSLLTTRKRRRTRNMQIQQLHSESSQQQLAAATGRRGIYRRPLPSTVVAFNSESGRKLFGEALSQGGLEGSYWSLSENFNTQSEPSSCGPGTLAMVLNSLAIDPQRKWKGVWRWFTEDLLIKCCFDSKKLESSGTTLTELAGCARCNGANVKLKLASDEGETIETFRESLRRCTMDPSSGGNVGSDCGLMVCSEERMVVSFDRGALQQTGTGHFSSIGAFHPEEDKVLVMEVARFKYFPFWCSTQVMWDAMKSVDPTTGESRGYMTVQRAEPPGQCQIHSHESGPHLCGAVSYTHLTLPTKRIV